MAAPARRRLPAPERRAALLAAAETVFAEHGYHGASVDLVAQEAGVSKALIYEHFQSKRELHASLVQRFADELFERFRANAAGGATGEQRLRGGAEAFLRFVQDHPAAYRMLYRDALDPEVADVLMGVQSQATNVIAALMAADPETPDLDERTTEIFAQLLSGAVQSLAVWWHDHPETPLDELVERVVDFAWRGVESLSRR